VAAASPASAQSLATRLSTEIERNRNILAALPSSPLGQGEMPRLKGLLDDADTLLKANRVSAVLETLSSAIPGIGGLRRASTGWDDAGNGAGKGIDALTKEWEAVGLALKVDRPKFPAQAPAGENASIRALAEQSVGQIDEQYAVAVDYGRLSGTSAGAYYLGRAEGQMALALFLSGLPKERLRGALTLPPLATPIAALEDDIVAAYAKPGSTSEHTNFIVANSSLKLARELDQKGWRLGALVTMMRSRLALALATMAPSTDDQDKTAASALDALERQFAASKLDQSIGDAWVEKARIALEKSRAGGEGADRERLRAAALSSEVLPRYWQIVRVAEVEMNEGFRK
jgi:hypothetical protein